MPLIKLTEEDIAKCKAFAASSKNDNYSQRNQHNAAVKTRQIFVGKLGEVSACRFIAQTCPELTQPDFNIYPANKKNWKPDLVCRDNRFHVKTMGSDQAALYGLSWTFQFSNASGKGGKDTEIFGSTTYTQAFVALVEVDLKDYSAMIYSVLQAKRLFDENLFRDPKLDYLKGIKKCVYHVDLEQVGLVGKFDHENL